MTSPAIRTRREIEDVGGPGCAAAEGGGRAEVPRGGDASGRHQCRLPDGALRVQAQERR